MNTHFISYSFWKRATQTSCKDEKLRSIIMFPLLAVFYGTNITIYHAHSTPLLIPGHLHSDDSSSRHIRSDSRAKRRIQSKQVVAIHAQNKHQLVSKNCVETDDRLRHSLIQSVHFTFYSTHILCVHIGFGANQTLSNWQMTIVRSPKERSHILKRSELQ